jgi:hypothetical protein
VQQLAAAHAALQKEATPKEPNKDDRAIQIYAKPEGERTPEEQSYLKGYDQYIQKNKIAPVQVRNEGMQAAREYAIIDPKTQQLRYATPAEIKQMNSGDGSNAPVPAAQGTQAMNKEALIEDIRGGSRQVRESLNSMGDADMNFPNRALIAGALKSRDPRGAVSALIAGELKGSLNDKQQDYLINVANLSENAMAMRSVLGAGQGSEDLRQAILATIPSGQTPTKEYGLKQLDTFEKTLTRLERGVPNVPLRDNGAPPSKTSGETPLRAIHDDGSTWEYSGQGKKSDIKNWKQVKTQ